MNKLLYPFGIAGLSLGLGIAGTGVASINENVRGNLLQSGVAAGKFITPSANIAASGFLLKQLKDLKKR